MITCQSVSLKYDNNLDFVIKNVNIDIPSNSITIIKGPNGSGKTSLLRALAGLINCTEGQINWLGKDITTDNDYLNNICYLDHKIAIKPYLNTLDNLTIWADLKDTHLLLAPSIRFFGLEPILTVRIGLLSMGWKKKIALARLMIMNTPIWLLDEPEVNLDKSSVDKLLNMIQSKVHNGTIIIASHSENLYQDYNFINLQNYT